MSGDRSEGWNDIARQFMAARSDTGASLVLSWAHDNIAPSGSVIDIGCGTGVPIAQTLSGAGFDVFGIDASPRMVSAFRRTIPHAQVACEAAQESPLFNRTFDGAIVIGLLFLLSADDQHEVIRKVANALKPGGRLLFSAPREECEWQDAQTGRHSQSLGAEAYRQLLQASGLQLVGCSVDEGANNYYDALKSAV